MQEPRRQQGVSSSADGSNLEIRPAPAQKTDPEGSQTGDSPSLSELASGVVHNLQNIVRSEVQLAKVELKEEAKVAGKGVAMLAAGALIGFYALGLFLLTAVWALATQVDRWLAALIVAVIVTVIAGILAMVGKKKLDEFSPVPEETVQSVKEDVEWVKQQTP